MYSFRLAAASLLVVLTSAMVLAQTEDGQRRRPRGPRDPQQTLKRLDSNNDGKVSREEWSRRSELFDRLDANRDGFITTDEAGAMRGRMRDRRPGNRRSLQEMDKNGDRLISRDEWTGRPEAFNRLDRDGNGTISMEELVSGRGQRRRPSDPSSPVPPTRPPV